jgi:glutaminyl-peptide cyclotransferase
LEKNGNINCNIFIFKDVMVLLDLIGVSDPSFYSYFPQTDKWYKRLINAEDQLASMRLLADYSYGLDGYPKQRYFNHQSVHAGIEDDHIPFLQRGNYLPAN